VTSERNGEKQTRTLGQQKKGELEKARGPGKGTKNKKQKPTQVGQGLQLGLIQMDGLKTGKLGGVLWGGGGGGGRDHFCPFSGFIYLLALRRDTLFVSFSKTVLNSHFIATTYERSNGRLKGGFARTRRWVLSINKLTD